MLKTDLSHRKQYYFFYNSIITKSFKEYAESLRKLEGTFPADQFKTN